MIRLTQLRDVAVGSQNALTLSCVYISIWEVVSATLNVLLMQVGQNRKPSLSSTVGVWISSVDLTQPAWIQVSALPFSTQFSMFPFPHLRSANYDNNTLLVTCWELIGVKSLERCLACPDTRSGGCCSCHDEVDKELCSSQGWFYLPLKYVLFIESGLPWWLSGKESACHTGDTGSIPGLGRSPGEGNGSSLQCSCLETPGGAWWVRGSTESDPAERLT